MNTSLHVVGSAGGPTLAQDPVDRIFGPAGAFRAALGPAYTPRPPQIALAKGIALGLREDCIVIAEGPCGTGKSYAYLAPAILSSLEREDGGPVCIATENNSLLEQLVEKDIPAVLQALRQLTPRATDIKFAALKGRSNYACLERLENPDYDGLEPQQVAQVEQIVDLLTRPGADGDASHLPIAVAPQAWARLSVGPDDCSRDACAFKSQCFANRAKQRANDADIVVTNYHLLFTHLAFQAKTGEAVVLPKFETLICDEAHEAADIAREILGFTLSTWHFRRLATKARKIGAESLAESINAAANRFFADVAQHARGPEYSARLRRPNWIQGGHLIDVLRRTGSHAAARVEAGDLPDKQHKIAERLASDARKLLKTVRDVVSLEDPDTVYWIEIGERTTRRGTEQTVSLQARALSVAGAMQSLLWEQVPRVVLTSATLSVNGRFEYLRRELGVPSRASGAGTDPIEIEVPSPFDFPRNALLVIPDPTRFPSPPTAGDDGLQYAEAVADATQTVIDACGGRTLVLCSSFRNLQAVHEHLVSRPQRVAIMRQGELPRAELVRRFKATPSVLLGSNSFRTGFDVPGDALLGLVIDKMPFPSPSDPIVDAVQERDPKAFFNYSLPRAVIALKQAFGRLIRTSTDVGVIVIADPRLLQKQYGSGVIRSLPRAGFSRDLGAIPRFIARVRPGLERS